MVFNVKKRTGVKTLAIRCCAVIVTLVLPAHVVPSVLLQVSVAMSHTFSTAADATELGGDAERGFFDCRRGCSRGSREAVASLGREQLKSSI